jgi:hypothetical protein
MASRRKVFEESGKVVGLKDLKKGAGGTPVTFRFNVTNIDGGGQEDGAGIITWHANDPVYASYHGSLTIGRDRFEWDSIEMGKEVGGVIKGVEIVTFSKSQNLKGWMKNPFIMETEMNISNEDFKNTAYEWP